MSPFNMCVCACVSLFVYLCVLKEWVEAIYDLREISAILRVGKNIYAISWMH